VKAVQSAERAAAVKSAARAAAVKNAKRAEDAKSASADNAVDRVLVISVDGLNPRAITRLGRSGTPAFHRLMRQGSWTFNARTAREQTRTLPNHTGMLTGRRINDRAGGHGVTFNKDRGTTVHRAAGRYVASAFDVVHDRGGKTALYSAKPKFRFFQRSYNRDGRADKVGKNHGRAKIDTVRITGNNSYLVRRLNAELRTRPATFTFLHISLPDAAGHRHGFMGRRYLAAVKRTDTLLGSVLATVAGQPSLRRDMLVVLTADHGGNGASHNDPARLQNYRVPFMALGPGVPAGRDLYAINPSFRNPGSSRPGYRGRQPIRNGDVANLVTDVLDLPLVPGSEFNRPRRLNVFSR